MITACKHKQPLSRSHGTIGENPALNNADHKALNSRFGYYSTSHGIGMAVTLDYDNGMLNKRPRPFTFLHQVTSHRHGTIGEGYISGNPHTEAYRSRFGWYSTIHGIGIKADSDYDNGMLNTSARAITFKAMAPLANSTKTRTHRTKPLTTALAFTPQAQALAWL